MGILSLPFFSPLQRKKPPIGEAFNVCGLRSIFAHVQKVNCPGGAREATLGCAAVEKDDNVIRRKDGELCETVSGFFFH